MAAMARRKRTKKIRRIKTESETVRKAVDLAGLQREVMQGYDRVAGRIPRFEDLCAPHRLDRRKAPWS